MTTTFTKQIQPQDGNWIVTIGITSKDPADVTLAQQYGDLELDFAGAYVDPADSTFSFTIPKDAMSIYSDILLNKLPNVTYTYDFNDASILSVTRYRQAVVYCNAVITQIQAAFAALRLLPATAPVNSTFTA